MSTSFGHPLPTREEFVFFEDDYVKASLSHRPSTPGETIAHIKLGPLKQLEKDVFISVLSSAKKVAAIVKTGMKVQRVSLVTTADSEIQLIPLHGVEAEWKPVMHPQLEYYETYPGYISSRSGSKLSDEALVKAQTEITSGKPTAMDLTCISDDETSNNLFAKIIRGELEQWRVWESKTHIAFLTPFGNTYGKTVLIPRKHTNSDILSLTEQDYTDLASAVWEAMQMIVTSDLAADQVGLIFEGMEVNWAHAKLIPICGNGGREAPEQPFTEIYDGSVSSQPGPVADIESLQRILSRFSAVSI